MLPARYGMRLFDLALGKVQENVQTAYLKMYRLVNRLSESEFEEYIENNIKPLSEYIFGELPCDILSVTHSAICERLQYLMFQLNTLSNYELCLIYLIGFHKRLTEHTMTLMPINTSSTEMLRNLNLLQHYVMYRNELSGFYEDDANINLVLPKSVMSYLLPTFANLTAIKLQYVDNEVLDGILKNCEKLTKVDVSGSADITDRIINTLLKANRLRILDLTSTSITVNGYLRLFNVLKQIVYFGDSFPFVHAVNDAIQENRSGYGLRRAFLTIDRTTILPDFSTVVPLLNILEISIIGQNQQYLLIPNLQKLCTLKCTLNLTHLITHNVTVGEELEHLPGGPVLNSLKKLEMYATRDVSMRTLELLDVLCPNLEILKLKICNGELEVPDEIRSYPIFKNLKDFQCDSSILGTEIYQRILAFCKDIQNIRLKNCPIDRLNAHWIAGILSTNPLKKLESIHLNPCQIREPRLRSMLRRCRNLKFYKAVYRPYDRERSSYGIIKTMSSSRVYDDEASRRLRELAAINNIPDL